jgi:altronate hydrolase|tara:strand:- start:272 stop:454 length:183 start_codon:yes stop_codon:yes gene_type:complete
MMEDMDVNCGTIVDGTETLEEIGERIFQEMLVTESGRKTKSEQLGVGDAEFVPWQTWAQM